MEILVPSLAALIAVSTTAGVVPRGVQAYVSRSPVSRFDHGASLDVIVRARIIRSSARVGAGLAPPMPRMVARRTTVSAADGRAVPALVYDFE